MMDQTTPIQFTLTNPATTVQTAVLLAGSKRAVALAGRTLRDTDFKAETGDTVIAVTGTTDTSMKTILDLMPFFQGAVTQIKVKSSNARQLITAPQQKTYVTPGPDIWADVTAFRVLGSGDDEGKVIFLFDQPFVAGASQSLLLVLQPGVTVSVEMFVSFSRI